MVTADATLPCPQCGRPVGQHTIDGYGECLRAQGFDYTLPYQNVPDGPMHFPAAADNQIMVGEVTVRTMALDSPLGRLPVLAFTFYGPGFEPMSKIPSPEYLLVGDERLMHDVVDLVTAAATKIIAAVR